jgi:hypothetical protein
MGCYNSGKLNRAMRLARGMLSPYLSSFRLIASTTVARVRVRPVEAFLM